MILRENDFLPGHLKQYQGDVRFVAKQLKWLAETYSADVNDIKSRSSFLVAELLLGLSYENALHIHRLDVITGLKTEAETEAEFIYPVARSTVKRDIDLYHQRVRHLEATFNKSAGPAPLTSAQYRRRFMEALDGAAVNEQQACRNL